MVLMSNTLDSLTWHDGRLISASFEADEAGAYSLVLTLDLLVSLQSSARRTVTLVCAENCDLKLTLRGQPLQAHYRFGNIADAAVDLAGKVKSLKLIFVEGQMLHVVCGRIGLLGVGS